MTDTVRLIVAVLCGIVWLIAMYYLYKQGKPIYQEQYEAQLKKLNEELNNLNKE